MQKLPVSVAFASALLCAGSALAGLPPPQKTAADYERELSKTVAPPVVESPGSTAGARCPEGKIWDEEEKWCDEAPKALQGYSLGVRHAEGQIAASAQQPPIHRAVRPAAPPRTVTPVVVPVVNARSNLLVEFENSSADLSPQGRSNLSEFAKYMASDNGGGERVQIGGHTNAVGSHAYNLALSSKRAEVVKNYLVKLGVSPARLEARGFGYDQPKVLQAPTAPENRRVEAKVLQ